MERKIILDVSGLLCSEIGTAQVFGIKESLTTLDKEVELVGGIEGEATLNHLEGEKLLGFFNLKTVLELICVRCLKKFSLPLRLNYEQLFVAKGEEDSFPIINNKIIDILLSIRQEILLSVPIKPLCSKKCKIIK